MKIIKLALLSSIGLLAMSCVSRKEFEQAKANYESCLERNVEKDRSITSLKERNKSLEEQMNLIRKQNDVLQQNLADCMATGKAGTVNIDKLISQINESNAYIKRLTEARAKNDSLNLALSNKLKRSLDNLNDSDVDVQVQKGVVFISLSDKMLYKSGSYDVLPTAENVLEKVAKIINDYKDYDVQVQGYTDNDQFKNSAAGCIRDNWDLSAMRATSVVKMLQTKFGVDPARLLAGGHGEYQPKVPNTNPENKAVNRRTEIVILPKLDQFMQLMDQKVK
ncbi:MULTISPECIES: flagellar motor protein MotB [Apibacter]|uniref:OmpA/MotB family protein n=1 Tax=Apibacter TaxID=1778601 RepID=UPI00132919CE|nr:MULTISPECIES: flagellar motor protein MotB [Apibacter]MCX8677755.1 flagellar motor protein MotB [Apibacter sp. B3919]MXO25031.1 OmpA family protein [Apibacter sp. B3924]MXO27218.1 OmpA family protein [Apibacter sp. B3813]MXO29031.1 OmpA family protein [Apibacter sp. B3913]MXO31188.1 OmpA family protein [Apibacter sp. B3912]